MAQVILPTTPYLGGVHFHAFSGTEVTTGTFFSTPITRPIWSKGCLIVLKLDNSTTPSWLLRIQTPAGGTVGSANYLNWSADIPAHTDDNYNVHLYYPGYTVGAVSTSIDVNLDMPVPMHFVLRMAVTGTADAEVWIQWLA